MGALRRIAASYWTALALGVVAVALHVRWYSVDKVAGGEVLSGFGATLVALGIFVASRPYLRGGLSPVIKAGLPQRRGAFAVGPEYHESLRRARDAALPLVTRDVWAERVVAVTIVVLGTLLNGYGPLIARVMGLR